MYCDINKNINNTKQKNELINYFLSIYKKILIYKLNKK